MIKTEDEIKCPYVAHVLFAHELLFVRKIVDMNDRRSQAIPIITLATMQYIALIAYETDQWIRGLSNTVSMEGNEQLACLRRQFKGLADSSIPVQDYDVRCAEVIHRSRRIFNSSVRLRLFRFLQPDFGIHVLDGIEVASTLGISRCLFLHQDSMTKGSDGVPSMSETSSHMGYLIGEHLARLSYLGSGIIPNYELRTYSEPKVTASQYDFHFTRYVKSIRKKFGGDVPPAFLFTISDTYYNLNTVDVLLNNKIIDDVLATKLRVISLYEFIKSASRLSKYAHRPLCEINIPDEAIHKLTMIFDRDQRKDIESWKPVRNVLVHYGPYPKKINNDSAGVALEHNHALNSIASLAHRKWANLRLDAESLANRYRSIVKQYIGIQLTKKDKRELLNHG